MIIVVKLGKGWAEFGAIELSLGVAVPRQNKGLGDMAQGRGNRLAPIYLLSP